jgi:glycosyltransferase involved in cell wall biosynthesis
MKIKIDFLIIPENLHWGGSELLWTRLVIILKQRGYQVLVLKFDDLLLPKEIEATFIENEIKVLNIPKNKISKLQNFINRFLPYNVRFRKKDLRLNSIKNIIPKLIVANKGFNINGVKLLKDINNLNFKYVTISHGVSELFWPNKLLRFEMLHTYQNALHNYFVSNDNLVVTQIQIGKKLTNASTIRNPFQVNYHDILPYPKHKTYHLACVARFDFKTKGQDVLLRVLMEEKWRNRPIMVHFYGDGEDEENLKDIISNYQLHNVKLHEYTSTRDIWKDMQALILPSRSEGLPISLVEAMLCGRIGIVTDVGGAKEVMLHGQTGFIAEAPRPLALDRAMEEAWQRRDDWETMGINACNHIKTLVPESPEEVFADKLIELIT